jgi:hypothetical protein
VVVPNHGLGSEILAVIFLGGGGGKSRFGVGNDDGGSSKR